MDDLLKQSIPSNKKEWVTLVLIVLAIVALCMFAFNQFLAVKYKVELISNACWNCEHQGNYCYGEPLGGSKDSTNSFNFSLDLPKK